VFALDEQAIAVVTACQKAKGWQEVCGLCAADASGAHHFLALTNHALDPWSFETSTNDEAILRSILVRRGWQIVAFVHTHIGSSVEMSEQDTRSYRRDILPWIIVAIDGEEVRQHCYGSP
jgi:proteasome lid subunit RPN8/RPN11